MQPQPIQHSTKVSRIALISCYFGVLPDYFCLFIKSIRSNPSINWILFTDQEPSLDPPSNLLWIKLTINELSQNFSIKLKISIELKNPYEICNLRPSFGFVFADYLSDYDLWGHTDLDMIYGDLRKFLPENILNDHERIYVRGHLSIYRNSNKINKAFMLGSPETPDYREVFLNPAILPQFDEWPGIWKIFRYHRIKQYHADVIADIHPPSTYKVRRFDATELENYAHQFFYWHQGKTYQAYYHWEGGLFDHEVAYVHFQKRKLPAPKFEASEINGFTIGPLGFAPYDLENLTREEMSLLNPTRWKSFAEITAVAKRRFIRRLNKVTSFLHK